MMVAEVAGGDTGEVEPLGGTVLASSSSRGGGDSIGDYNGMHVVEQKASIYGGVVGGGWIRRSPELKETRNSSP
jgi:hypothetical protein